METAVNNKDVILWEIAPEQNGLQNIKYEYFIYHILLFDMHSWQISYDECGML
jgi:hypothetical protein